MKNLNGKKILLIICGGIAAYKSLEIIRLLKKNGSYVKTILTNNAKNFLRKAIKLNNFFPPFMQLYCKLNLAKSQNQLIKILKQYS